MYNHNYYQQNQSQPVQYQSGYGNNFAPNSASNSSVSSLNAYQNNGSNNNNNNNNSGNSNGQIPQLWMGELDQRWDDTTIKQIWTSLLSSMGIIIHSVKLIKDKQSSQLGLANAGYCFIRFHNFEDASKVLNAFNGKPIPGTNNQHYFRLNWSSANIQAAASAAAVTTSLPLPSTSTAPIEHSIFVGDLPQNINDQILLQTFQSRYPSCTNVKIMVDQTTGHIKGYGFVKFLNEEDQQRALLEMQGFILLGRPIRVSTAAKSANQLGTRSGSPANPNMGLNNSYMLPPLQQQAQQPHEQSQQIRQQSQLLPQQQQQYSMSQSPSPVAMQNKNSNPPLASTVPLQYYNDPTNTTVFIGGLNVPFSENQLRDLFVKYGDVTYVKIPEGKNCGFVQYYHRASAEIAINEMQGYDIGGGCKIRVSWGARAAQRSWFARQLQEQQIDQPQQQLQSSQPSTLDQQQDLNFMINLSQTQNMVNSLGLSGSNLNINDQIINNGYSLDQFQLQNEEIPFNTINSNNGILSTKNDELKLNKLLLAARDGNLDQIDIGSNLYNV